MAERKRHSPVKDPIHGFIELNEDEWSVVDDPNFQRLRYIKQIGFAFLVYPGANHTRFEHSIGTMKMTRDICKALGTDPEEASMAGLLHDIGHTPFSHDSEFVLGEYLKTDHEQVGKDIISNSSIRDRISESTISFKRVMGYFDNINEAKVISGPLGSDRMDYLLRDSYYTGTPYGTIEYEMIKNRMNLINGEPAIMESGIENAESMLISRYHMWMSVYYHHAIIIAAEMFKKSLRMAIEGGDLDPNELIGATDIDITNKLYSSKTQASELFKNVLKRKLFKRVIFKNTASDINIEAIKSHLINSGIGPGSFIAARVRLSGANDDMPVSDREGNRLGNLSEKSELFNILSKTLKSKNLTVIASDEKSIGAVSSATKEYSKNNPI